MPWPFAFALASAGRRSPARMAMMAITTSNSINVNAYFRLVFVGCVIEALTVLVVKFLDL